jgi:hypothetical protein
MKLDLVDYLVLFVISLFVVSLTVVPWLIGIYSMLKMVYEVVK